MSLPNVTAGPSPKLSQRPGSAASAPRTSSAGRDLLLDALAVSCATVFIAWLSGAERFTFLHTPDSEFYFSLGAFGAEVTDRAPFDQYYWTKLGTILPVHYLTEVLGLWAAREAWRALLILVIVASVFGLARSRLSRLGATNAALFVGLNTVILGHVGDPYATGTALAALSLTVALTFAWLHRPRSYGPPIALGGALGWLVMVNPYCLLVAAGIATGMAAPMLRDVAQRGLLRLELQATAALISFGTAVGLFLVAGSWEFPGKSWRTEVLSFVRTAELDTWAEPTWAWLATETSLLVPASSIVLTAGFFWLVPGTRTLQASALGLATTPFVFAVIFKVLTQGNTLETSYYNAMLWPSALMALVVSILALGPEPGPGPVSSAVLLATVGGWIASGHWSGQVDPAAAAVCILALAVGLLLVVRRTRLREPMALLLILGTLGIAYQLVQNGRPPRTDSIHPRVAYSGAFRSNDAEHVIRQAVAFESWLLGETPRNAQILLWKESGNLPAASPGAMQLWGPNGVWAENPNQLLTSYDLEPIASVADLVVTLAGSRQVSDTMSRTLVGDGAGTPTCKDFPAAGGSTQFLRACILELP